MQKAPVYAIFDLLGVLIDWNPRHLFRILYRGDTIAMERFLATICPPTWNEMQDAGRPIEEAVSEALNRYPDHRVMIEAYYGQFDRMMKGANAGAVQVLEKLHANGVHLYALANFSAETFPLAEARFDFLRLFKAIMVSGQEGIAKPDSRLYARMVQRHAINPRRTIFIDGFARNLPPAAALGMQTIHYTNADSLSSKLRQFGVL